jgi:hypothetical protein
MVEGQGKLGKELISVEAEIYYMTKLEEVMYMSGSLMGMQYKAPILFNHVMNYKEKVHEEHEVLVEQITSPREREKHKKSQPKTTVVTDRFFFKSFHMPKGIGMSIIDESKNLAAEIADVDIDSMDIVSEELEPGQQKEPECSDSELEYRSPVKKDFG